MKKRIISALLAVITILSLFVMPITVGAAEVNNGAQANKYETALENMVLKHTSDDPTKEGENDGVLELWMNEETGEMAVKNKLTGEITFTNPVNVDEIYDNQLDAGIHKSQLYVNFFDLTYGPSSMSTMYSYNDCFLPSKGAIEAQRQYKISDTENGVRVLYTLGEIDKKFAVPLKISYYKLRDMLIAGGQFANDQAVDTYLKVSNNDLEIFFPALPKNYEYDENGNTIYQLDEDGNPTNIPVPKKDANGEIEYEYTVYKQEEMVKQFPESETTPFVYLSTGTYNSRDKMKEFEKKLQGYNPDYFQVAQTDEDEPTELDKDMTELWNESVDRARFPHKSYTQITLAVEYNLTSTGLEAVIDTSSIDYDKTKYCLATISVLPYFGASSLYTKEATKDEPGKEIIDDGYIFVPDGSGAISDFREIKQRGVVGNLSLQLYGPDYAYYQITGKNSELATMPVFGLVNKTNLLTEQETSSPTGFFAIIKEGDALASVVSSTERNYASVYSSFTYANYDIYDIKDLFNSGATSTKQIAVVSDKFYQGKYRTEYYLLSDDEAAKQGGFYGASYVEMAKLYREYLGNSFGTNEKGEKLFSKITNPKENVSLFLEAFGSIKKNDTFLTLFPITVDSKLTTFDDILNIQKELSAGISAPKKDANGNIVKDDEGNIVYEAIPNTGIKNISFILNGFYNGGLSTKYPTSVKWQSVLGGKKGVKNLIEKANESDEFDVALDVNFSYSQGSSLFSGYSDKKHAVRTLDDRYTTKRAYYAATQIFERTSGVAVSSASFESLYDKFVKSISKYDFTTLATRTLGSDLNSDFDKDDYYTRQDALNKTVDLLKKATGKYSLALDGGNAYSMGYASYVLNAPLDSSKYDKANQPVPFFGMVYHGSVEFAGGAMNMEGDQDYLFLKSLENGAALYYIIVKQNPESIKLDDEYNKYYSVQYDLLKDKILALYNEYNSLMKDKQSLYIVDHQFVNNGTSAAWYDAQDTVWSVCFQDGTTVNNSLVTYVEYEDGSGFFLNYNDKTVQINIYDEAGEQIIDEIKIPAMGYHVVKAN